MTPTKVPLTNKWYNRLKWTITVFLPAVGAFYFGLAQVWDFNRVPGVNGTINLLITFGGVFLAYSTSQYNKTANAPDGEFIVNQVDGEKFPALGVRKGSSIEELASKDKVTLTVVNNTPVDTSDEPQTTPPAA